MNEAERRAASEKYYQKLRAELDERIRGDKQLRKIAEKIANKTADFNDTAKYSEIVSNYIGAVLQENVGEITSPVAKEFVCKELLRDQHSTINELFESVQVSIDEQNGIHIKTQKPKFPEERVDKVAHALEDPTVPLKTIKRRANAPVANVSKSFHDDCVKKNAQFRHDAGLKCYIVRIGTKCCEWCSEVAGKYEFGDQPDGIFRRHDNCDCTIIYDGQVLRGKQNADGSRSKTWEEVPNANGADSEPTTFTQEEAKELERRNLAQIRGLHSSYPLKGSSEIEFEKIDGSKSISKELDKEYRDEYDKFTERFGKLSSLKGIDIAPYANDNVYGQYFPESRRIVIYGVGGKSGDKFITESAQAHKSNEEWSTGSKYHSFRHELGHALQMELSLNDKYWQNKRTEIENLRLNIVSALTNDDGSVKIKELKGKLSKYGFVDTDEFISESIAEYSQNPKKARSTSKKVVEILMRGDEYYVNVDTR